MNDKDKGFTAYNNDFIRSDEFDIYEHSLLEVLLTYSHYEKIDFLSHEKLANQSRMSVRQVIRTQKKLKQKGYIKYKRSPSQRPNIYSLTSKAMTHRHTTMTDSHISSDSQAELGVTHRHTYKEDIIKKEKEINKEKEKIPYKEIVEFLNETLGKSNGSGFKHTTKKTQEKIRARWSEGFRLPDFKEVIRKTCLNWKGKTWTDKQGKSVDAEQFLTPITLFNEKFENRLHAKVDIIKEESKPHYYNEDWRDKYG